MPRPKCLNTVSLSPPAHEPNIRSHRWANVYTGEWGSQAAKDEYDRLIGERIANSRETPRRV
jgi:hypothetical protein